MTRMSGCMIAICHQAIFSLSNICLFLESSCKKILDFQIAFKNTQYWTVWCRILRKEKECGKCPDYPRNCSHFVCNITYGVELLVRFPKKGFPEEDAKIHSLFKERKSSEIQKDVTCKILINCNEIREMTLGELLEFLNKLDEGEHSQYDVPIRFSYGKLDWDIKNSAPMNEEKIALFLSYLYCVYRKIEIIMEDPEQTYLPNSLANIESDLQQAEKDYQEMNRNDFTKMHPVLKKLFFSYINYIQYYIENGMNICKNDDFPRAVDEMKNWLQKLNTWSPENSAAKQSAVDVVEGLITTFHRWFPNWNSR